MKLRFVIPFFLIFLGPSLFGQGPGNVVNGVTRTRTTGLTETELSKTFDLAYGQLNATSITPGTFYLVRHEGTSRRLLKGKLVLFSSPVGIVVYFAVTPKKSVTYCEGIGILRYENSRWSICSLDSEGNESEWLEIKTDGKTIAWCTHGINFVEFQVWQRMDEYHLIDKYLERELSRVRPLVDNLVVKRASKP